MLDCYTPQAAQAVPIVPLRRKALKEWLETQDERVRNWVAVHEFTGKAHAHLMVPTASGAPEQVLVGVHGPDDFWAFGGLAAKLPQGDYRLDCDWDENQRTRAVIAWGLGAYRFERYKRSDRSLPRLLLDGRPERVDAVVRSAYLVRDLINTPAEDMMPQDLAHAARELADEFGARFSETVGNELLEHGFPMIHAVGRASVHVPRLIDLRWGEEQAPKLTLVGKGVCFDSGGLDLKPANGMRLMKKDMGGAAHVLGLARLIMSTGLPVRLRVLIPAVENAVSGSSFRPGDVLPTRKGLTVEIDNTDAEGRLVLCDALAEAGTEDPGLIVDFATLTGAARVALGTEIPAFFTESDALAAALTGVADAEGDPVWRLPLHKPYRRELDSAIADLANASSSGYGGAITAALFLHRFVPKGVEWLHYDVMAWNLSARAGRPKGGEAMGLYATFRYLEQRFGNAPE